MDGSASKHQGTAEEYFQSRFMPGTSPGELWDQLKGIQWPSRGQAFPTRSSAHSRFRITRVCKRKALLFADFKHSLSQWAVRFGHDEKE